MNLIGKVSALKKLVFLYVSVLYVYNMQIIKYII